LPVALRRVIYFFTTKNTKGTKKYFFLRVLRDLRGSIGFHMRMSKMFSQTLRAAPSDAEVASHQLLLRAGYIRQLGAGIFSYLPLAKRALTKIENIMRDEMNAIGGQELSMPVVHPADVWKETGRWYQVGAEMGRFKDRADRDMALAMTHEEVVADRRGRGRARRAISCALSGVL